MDFRKDIPEKVSISVTSPLNLLNNKQKSIYKMIDFTNKNMLSSISRCRMNFYFRSGNKTLIFIKIIYLESLYFYACASPYKKTWTIWNRVGVRFKDALSK